MSSDRWPGGPSFSVVMKLPFGISYMFIYLAEDQPAAPEISPVFLMRSGM